MYRNIGKTISDHTEVATCQSSLGSSHVDQLQHVCIAHKYAGVVITSASSIKQLLYGLVLCTSQPYVPRGEAPKAAAANISWHSLMQLLHQFY